MTEKAVENFIEEVESEKNDFDRFINCWLKFRRVDSIKQLEGDCQQLICKFFNAIANDDPSFTEDLEEDIQYCRKKY